MWAKHKQSGFTIVELLIVVVVIAILAAITIVSYNGIQNRAKTSSADAALSQASKKIKLWQVDNPSQVPDCATFSSLVGATTSTCAPTVRDISYEYSQLANQAFCITATISSKSFKITESTQPVAGSCVGHARDGSPVVTNLVLNPSTDGSSGWASSGAVGAGAYVTGFDGATRAYRATRTGTGAAVIRGTTAAIAPSTPYSVVVTLRSDIANTVYVQLRGTPSSGDSSTFTSVELQPNQPQTVRATGISWSGNHTSPNLSIAWSTGGDTNWLEVTKAIVVTGSDYTGNFNNGYSTDWIWNGTPNNSTSSGPSQ